MASEVEICNRALQKLGAKRIVSLTEDSTNGRACNFAYPIIRDAELRKHRWNFAIKRAQLAASSTPPLFTKARAFPLPADNLKLLKPDPEDNTADLDWQIEGQSIVTNDLAPLNIRYIWKVTDPNLMDPLFREALACSLAKELCEELTQSNAKKKGLDDDYKDFIFQAKRTNAIESVAQQPPADPWITARL